MNIIKIAGLYSKQVELIGSVSHFPSISKIIILPFFKKALIAIDSYPSLYWTDTRFLMLLLILLHSFTYLLFI